jgi:serine/threonine-protein kinase
MGDIFDDPFEQEKIPTAHIDIPYHKDAIGRKKENALKEGIDFGHYSLVSRIGEGGMGFVFKAVDNYNNDTVAIKILNQERVPEDQRRKFAQRFLREIIILSETPHPNLVPLRDYGEINSHIFYAMDFIEGRDLRSLIEECPLHPKDSVDMAKAIANALSVLHKKGIVHRDLKPENIMKGNKSERYVLIDLGIAKMLYAQTLTTMGKLLGTPDYMSPEQVSGLPFDERSDIYALASIHYESLCGQPPLWRHEKETMGSFFRRIREDMPEYIIGINPNVPVNLADFLQKGLAKKPEARYQSCEEYVEALEKLGI